MGRGEPEAEARARRRAALAAQLERAGQDARRADDFETARVCFETALELLGDADHARRARLHTQLSRMLMLAGDPAASLREARLAVDAAPPGPMVSIAEARLAVTLSKMGHVSDALVAARHAVEVAAASDDVEAEGTARMALGYALRNAGMPEPAAGEFGAAARLAATSGDHEAVVARLIDLAVSLYYAGDGNGAVSAARDAVAAGRRGGLSLGMPRAAYALYLFSTGRWQAAQRVVRDGLAAEPDFPWLRLMRARLLTGLGDLEQARRILESVEAGGGGPRSGGWDGPHEVAAELALASSQPAAALERVRTALAAMAAPERDHSVPALLILGLRAAADLRHRRGGAIAARRRETADELIDVLRRHVALARAAAAPASPVSPGGRLVADRALADAEYARAHGVDEPAHWQRAAELLAAQPAPWEEAYARRHHAAALVRAGGPLRDASASLTAAYRIAVQLQAGPLRRSIEGVAERSRLGLAPADSPLPASAAPREPRGLTVRERQVLALLGAGYTNRRIADSLRISEKTVSVHIGNLTAKLGVSNRLEAAAVAIRLAG